MIKIQNFVKGDNYYTLTFTEGMNAYGFLMVYAEEPLCIEFMKFANNGKDILTINEDTNPEEFMKLKDQYFDHIMEYIQKQSN